jgi:hypothetical protein
MLVRLQRQKPTDAGVARGRPAAFAPVRDPELRVCLARRAPANFVANFTIAGFMPNRGALYSLRERPNRAVSVVAGLAARGARAGMAMAFSALFRGRIGGRAARISTCKVAEAEAFSPQRGASRLVVLNRVTAWKRWSEESGMWIDLARSAPACSVGEATQRLTSASIRVSARRASRSR